MREGLCFSALHIPNGADKASFLNLLLKVTFSKRDYVKDLVPNGQLLTSNDINNTFG